MKTVSDRRMKSLLRAEEVARELRFQLERSRFKSEINTDQLFYRLSRWMDVTGKQKYTRP